MSIVIMHKFIENFLCTLFIDKLGSPRPAPSRGSVLGYLVGVSKLSFILFAKKADYRLYVFTQIKTGGVFQEKNFFSLLICFALGTTIPETISDFR